MFRRLIATALAAALTPAFFAAHAVASGETLTLAQGDAVAVAGKPTKFTASGDLNPADTATEFTVHIFLKDPQADSTCAADFFTESAKAAASSGKETEVGQPGFPVGNGSSFDQPFEITFAAAGEYLLCGYVQGDFSTFAADELLGSVSPAPAPEQPSSSRPGSGTTTPPAGGQTPVGLPAVLRAPWITQKGHVLTCHPGGWSNEPTSFAFGWFSKKGGKRLGSGRTLRVRRSFRGHPVRCRVTARNSAGSAAVSSGPLRAR